MNKYDIIRKIENFASVETAIKQTAGLRDFAVSMRFNLQFIIYGLRKSFVVIKNNTHPIDFAAFARAKLFS